MKSLLGKTILVTGGVGFAGSHVVEALIATGAKVIVLYRNIHPHSYFSTEKLDKNVTLVTCDLTDFENVRNVFMKYPIDYIIHLAAQTDVTVAFNHPLETIRINILGTVHILEAARKSGIKGVIVASTDKAYGKSKEIYKETDELRGDHPYEVSKAAADRIAMSYVKTYGMPVIVTRFGNFYGPGDLKISRIIPGIMGAVITKKTLTLRSDGTFVRDYVYVKDAARAYAFFLTHFEKARGEVYNVSSRESLSVIDVIKKAENVLRTDVPYTITNSAKNEIPYQHLNWNKMKKMGWEPKYTIEKGLKETYVWYKKHKIVFSD